MGGKDDILRCGGSSFIGFRIDQRKEQGEEIEILSSDARAHTRLVPLAFNTFAQMHLHFESFVALRWEGLTVAKCELAKALSTTKERTASWLAQAFSSEYAPAIILTIVPDAS